uniref:Uncharacterized protein n=1 Tax=Rhodosorus marinus TaxID=101924 RepID=A0A7S2ZFK8_9RHOD
MDRLFETETSSNIRLRGRPKLLNGTVSTVRCFGVSSPRRNLKTLPQPRRPLYLIDSMPKRTSSSSPSPPAEGCSSSCNAFCTTRIRSLAYFEFLGSFNRRSLSRRNLSLSSAFLLSSILVFASCPHSQVIAQKA